MSTKVRRNTGILTHTHTHTHTHTQAISRNNLDLVDAPKNNIEDIEKVSVYQRI